MDAVSAVGWAKCGQHPRECVSHSVPQSDLSGFPCVASLQPPRSCAASEHGHLSAWAACCSADLSVVDLTALINCIDALLLLSLLLFTP